MTIIFEQLRVGERPQASQLRKLLPKSRKKKFSSELGQKQRGNTKTGEPTLLDLLVDSRKFRGIIFASREEASASLLGSMESMWLTARTLEPKFLGCHPRTCSYYITPSKELLCALVFLTVKWEW